MKSLDYLVQLYPDKTGKELLAIQDEEKRQEDLEYENQHKEAIAIVEDIKKNGGFYKGAFSTTQYYMYKITSIEFDSDSVYCQVEKIILFDSQNIDKGALSKDTINFEIDTNKYVSFGDIRSSSIRIKEEEYNELKNYLFGVVPRFFKEEWELRQKEFGKK